MTHTSFVTTTRGLERDTPPIKLFEKAKRLGIWNPSDIDFIQDQRDWEQMNEDERDLVLRLTTMFQAGEEAVTLDLLPLVMVIAQENRLEEEMFLTTFLWEEAKHTDFFHRFLEEVLHAPTQGLSLYHTPNYYTIFYDALPHAMQRLREDSSPAAQAEASITYNMIVEGVLAETGYHAFLTALERNQLMPGLRQGIRYLQLDESRHIAYGIYLLSRLVAADASLWQIIESKMNELLMPALGIIGDAFAAYDPPPFGLRYDDFVDYATSQFSKRLARLEKARGASLVEIERVTSDAIEREDA